MLQAHGGSEWGLSYVGQDGHIVSMRFGYTCIQNKEIYAFVAHGSVWFYELDIDSGLAVNVRKAEDGQKVKRFMTANTCLDGDRVIVTNWNHYGFISILEFGKSCMKTYRCAINRLPSRCWLWYDGTIRRVVHENTPTGTTDIVVPHMIPYMGTKYETDIFGMSRSGICLIRIGMAIIVGWCIMRNAIIWAHDCRNAGITVMMGKYVADNIVQYMLQHTARGRTWHYYNVADGTDYEVI